MISKKDLDYLTEKITRRFEIELPLEIEQFNLENEKLTIIFQNKEVVRSFELTKGLVLEFDKENRIIGLKLDSISEYLPKNS